MRLSRVVFMLLFCASGHLYAQSEDALREYFEGRTVVVKQDLPAGKSGIDVYPDSGSPVNYADYNRRLKQLGVAIRRNEAGSLASVRAREKSIAVQLTASAGA